MRDPTIVMHSQSARFILNFIAGFVGSVILASSSFAGLGIIDVSRSAADCANARAKQPSALSAQQNDIASIGASVDGVSEKDLEHMVIEGSSALSDCLNDVRLQADEKGNDSPSFIREKLVEHLSMKYDSLPPKTQKLFQSKEKFVSLGLMARTLEGEVASLGKCAKNLDDTEGSSAPFPNIYAAARIMTNRADLVHRGSAVSSASPSASNGGEDPESVNDPYLNEARSAANVNWQEFASSAEAPQGNKSLDAILFHPKQFSLWNAKDPAKQWALCPPITPGTEYKDADGKLIATASVGAFLRWQAALQVSAEAIFSPSRFKQKTANLGHVYFYTSSRPTYEKRLNKDKWTPIRNRTIGHTVIDDFECLSLWKEPSIAQRAIIAAEAKAAAEAAAKAKAAALAAAAKSGASSTSQAANGSPSGKANPSTNANSKVSANTNTKPNLSPLASQAGLVRTPQKSPPQSSQGSRAPASGAATKITAPAKSSAQSLGSAAGTSKMTTVSKEPLKAPPNTVQKPKPAKPNQGSAESPRKN